MKNNNIIILAVFVVLVVLLLAFGVYSISENTTANNSSDEINLTMNETNDTTQTVSKTTTKKSTEKSDDDGIYFDEEMNVYFDKNDKTVYEGQVPKGTSKSEIQELSREMERETNGY